MLRHDALKTRFDRGEAAYGIVTARPDPDLIGASEVPPTPGRRWFPVSFLPPGQEARSAPAARLGMASLTAGANTSALRTRRFARCILLRMLRQLTPSTRSLRPRACAL